MTATRGSHRPPPPVRTVGGHDRDLDLDAYRPLVGHGLDPDRKPYVGFGAALPALAGYLLVRTFGAYVLWLWGSSQGKPLTDLFGRAWDANWLTGIAQNGYDLGEPLRSNLAFFPLFPGLIKAVDALSPLDAAGAGILLAWVSGAAAAWGLFALGTRLHDPRTGIMLAVLWGVIPHAVTESMAYTESLFTALAVWALYEVLQRRWITAGLLTLVAGLSRPTASALIGAVCLAALVAVVRRRDGWRPWLALLLAPLGWLAYLLWVGLRTGRLDGWFHIQGEGWGSRFDGGGYTLEQARQVLSRASELEMIMITLILVVSVGLFVLSLLDRQPWPLLVYSALMLATTLGGDGYYHSKARYLVPAFALLIPAAAALGRARTSRAVVVLTTLCLVSAYMGGYLLLVWRHSP
ncbi:hypothetical protein [Actinocorallia longicatena]|uniref:Glycosyltransferase family 39 protein n=1 Tax=Actinocorallia longicatena TaxID=111803 RepID=A0ABP6QNI5_9ACTN